MNHTCQSLLLQTLRRMQIGQLSLQLPDGSHFRIGSPDSQPLIQVTVHDSEFFKRVVLQTDIGLGESYIAGQWDTDNLSGFLKLLILNEPYFQNPASQPLLSLARKLALAADQLLHRFRSNTRSQSRRNIHAHYDLGNAFYQLFLDSSMTYSSAYFTDPEQSLQHAQEEKYDRLCRKLNLKSEHHLLEIGSGWGGFALHAARHYGCQVTTLTLSERQHAYVLEQIREHGLEAQIEIRLQDYRDIRGQFDRIASIEMLEAVGHEHLNHYFKQCARLLRPHGILGLQVILSPDSRYERYRRHVDYIRKHIFPGGHLPSIDSLHKAVRRSSDWDLQHLETFGTHYAATLRQWREQFNATEQSRRQLGFDDAFDRKWNFYFAYCEAGFDTRHIQVAQLVYASPNTLDYAYENSLHSNDDSRISRTAVDAVPQHNLQIHTL